ncbi:MAG: tRNA lysidine(34) synthetase TilS [Bacteroidaceae bacterium]|nr:tRNA lysidine(34) synthetase TilS [Bacteroidaceae bacterium]
MLQSNDRVIVALSGGADSVSLLLILSSLGYECHAAHCNFHLRGEESMRDEHFVEELCKKNNISLHKIDFQTTEYAKSHGISIEMAARELRYDYFAKLKKELNATAIAVGHHKNDNIETLFLNLVRGTGIKGICGIQPINNDIIRPLLCLTQTEIHDYLKSRNQDYVTDSTNLENVYSRNKIRLDIVPALSSINPAALDNIINTIENLNEVRKIYEANIKADISQCVKIHEDGSVLINISTLLSCVSASSVLHEIISPLGFNKSQENDIFMAMKNGETGKIFFSNSNILNIDREEIIITSQSKQTAQVTLLSQYSKIECKTVKAEELTIIKDKDYAYLDKNKIHGNLYVRLCKTGDYFYPFGMKGRKLISDYMTDRKFNRIKKNNQMVVCDENEEILWLVGERSSEKCRVDDNTTSVLVLHIKP